MYDNITTVLLRFGLCIHRAYIAILLSLAISVTTLAADMRFLSDEELHTADAVALQDEASLFQSVGDGFALLLAQCGITECVLAVSEMELNLLLEMLNVRIERVTSRQQQLEETSQFDETIARYQQQHEKYTLYLEQFYTLYGSVAEPDDSAAQSQAPQNELLDALLDYEDILPEDESEDALLEDADAALVEEAAPLDDSDAGDALLDGADALPEDALLED